jgi:hypothetical protein
MPAAHLTKAFSLCVFCDLYEKEGSNFAPNVMLDFTLVTPNYIKLPWIFS